MPQVRRRSALNGWLSEPIYAVRAREVVGRRRHILPSADLKETIGLRADQQIVLLLFDSDPILERLWEEASHLIPELAHEQMPIPVSNRATTGITVLGVSVNALSIQKGDDMSVTASIANAMPLIDDTTVVVTGPLGISVAAAMNQLVQL